MAGKKLHDNVLRTKAPSVLGRSVFIGLRALDVFWQYHLLSQGWLTRAIERLDGFLPRPYYSVVLMLSLGSSVKQILAMLLVSEQETPVASAAMIATFNTVINTVNTLLSVWMATRPASTSKSSSLVTNPIIVAGLAAYTVGILTELVSELQRRSFKRNPANKGKPYSGGLFSLARQINYGGYTLWRAGYATITGGVAWGGFVFSFFFYDFATRGVPVLDEYLVKRYGEPYKKVKRRVKYSLIPGIY
ncbi:hypothetical protein BO94DRAFT_562595 [Aspergillus sclerotioniger CBS 115572]|uniref:Uncharacterized protein n=1 Tax=Aspergillus sclerotioniger CBS 115572 TaxID=1450535 RepID=A0A317XGK3_9EURO|nr:hypothetical protein BO94DRAFT_562595 [Aspergillus sclerotioniger CBS 115572]PWY96060.1 hypothetical protein BO94DRAFT_562595 [Aspergillus sclerotioniger CBS 115572]